LRECAQDKVELWMEKEEDASEGEKCTHLDRHCGKKRGGIRPGRRRRASNGFRSRPPVLLGRDLKKEPPQNKVTGTCACGTARDFHAGKQPGTNSAHLGVNT